MTHTSFGRDILSNDTVSHCSSPPPPHHQLHLQESSCALGRWQTPPSSVAASLKYGTKVDLGSNNGRCKKSETSGATDQKLFYTFSKERLKSRNVVLFFVSIIFSNCAMASSLIFSHDVLEAYYNINTDDLPSIWKRWWCCQDGKRSRWVRRKGIGLNQCLPPSKEPHGVPSKERQTKHFGLARANTSIFLQHVLLSEIFCLHYLATLPDSH